MTAVVVVGLEQCGVGGGGGVVKRGGRIVAASEMLRPSVEHFQQAEVMPRGFKK